MEICHSTTPQLVDSDGDLVRCVLYDPQVNAELALQGIG
jgi:hypothetical protein